MTDISRHPLLQQAYDVCLAIEECGASVELTNAVTKASALLATLDKFIPVMPPEFSNLQPHQQRVAVEHAELNLKISSLSGFIGSQIWKTMDGSDQSLLQDQLECMRHYSAILARRLVKY